LLRRLLTATLLSLCLLIPARAADAPDPADWPAVLDAARDQTVWWHAWGGAPEVNAFIAWAGEQVAARHGVTVEHVKVADAGEAVARVLAEKAAGRETGGAVDLVWINGENFAAMKAAGLLHGPWAETIPNRRLADPAKAALFEADFTVRVEGLESPWGMAQLVFYHDAAATPAPPRTMAALLDFARARPGRFAYPAPPDFLGSTFLKQALHAFVADPAALAAPEEASDFAAVTAPLWAYLDALHPHLWRGGRAFPPSGARLRQMMADGETDLAFSFNPGEAAAGVATGDLPETVRTYALDGGTIANAHFVAIPFNASAKAGAMVVADFLLSPEAQARMADPRFWGSPTVLDVAALPAADRALFEAIPASPAAPAPGALGPALPEPHPSWMTRLEEEWARRYGAGR
jgi:putative thiamine transport system substrate-binding protein